jgi:hypothetical protein
VRECNKYSLCFQVDLKGLEDLVHHVHPDNINIYAVSMNTSPYSF